jgi:hypothetical protein
MPDALDDIMASDELSAEVKSLAVSAAELDVPATHEELKTDGVITYESLVTRMQEDNPSAKLSDVEAAVVAVWIF